MLGSLVKTDEYIEVAYGNFIIAKKTWYVQIKIGDDNGKRLFATLYNILFAPDLCDQTFYIILPMNLGHTCLFPKEFCTVFFGGNEHNAVT